MTDTPPAGEQARLKTCARCGSRDKPTPLPKGFGCSTCKSSPYCYGCNVTHDAWCGASDA